MRNFKKATAVLLAAIMAFSTFSALPFTASAAEVDSSNSVSAEFGDYEYQVLDDGTAEITKYKGEATGLVIPSEINDYKVTSIGDSAFSWSPNLTTVTIPEGVIHIGEEAFYECELPGVTIPSSVTYIGEKAFGFEQGKRIHLDDEYYPKVSINGFYIEGTPGTAAEKYAEENGFDFLIFGEPEKYTYNILDDGSIGITGYKGKSSDLIIPEEIDGYKVTAIMDYAFKYKTPLERVTIPDSVKTIGNSAFDGCKRIKYVKIGEKVENIGDYAFYECTRLSSVTIPESATSLGYLCFGYYQSYRFSPESGNKYPISEKYYITIFGKKGSAAQEYANENEFKFLESGKEFLYELLDNGTAEIIGYNGEKTDITFPSEVDGYKVTSIRNTEFYGSNPVISVTLPDGLTSIGDNAFSNCTDDLTSITIPDSVTEICYAAFANCTGLSSITIPDSVTNIWEYAFHYCTSLTSITFPDSVTTIGSCAFAECSNLERITIPDSLLSVGSGAFDETKWYNNQPDGVVYLGKLAYSYKGEMPENTKINLVSGTKAIIDCAFSENSNLTDIFIPDSIVKIGSSALQGCINLKSVTIPASVTDIGNYAIGYTYDADFDEETWKWVCKKIDEFTVCGYTGTAAEKYANEHDLLFEALDKEITGDIDGDGTLSVADATAIQKHLASLDELTPEQLALADFNGDGAVNVNDATAIQRALVKS